MSRQDLGYWEVVLQFTIDQMIWEKGYFSGK